MFEIVGWILFLIISLWLTLIGVIGAFGHRFVGVFRIEQVLTGWIVLIIGLRCLYCLIINAPFKIIMS